MNSPHIPSYRSFLPEKLLNKLWAEADEITEIEGLRITKGLREKFPTIETTEALQFITDLYQETREELAEILTQRDIDRQFIDRETSACVKRNEGVAYTSPDYETVIGKRDTKGRLVVGPHPEEQAPSVLSVEIPDFLAGDQVTLFGPPDTAKMSINAMNALNRKRPNEPELVTELVEAAGQVPRWGADNEDSKTPIMESFLQACENLTACFDRSLSYQDNQSGKSYRLDDTGLSKPIKRIPGIALPDGNHLLDGNPLPLHLFDFALHLWHNRSRPEALVFYIPKLENEEEAAYLKNLISRAEEKLVALGEGYQEGSIKVFLVFENPRAIFRIREMAEVLTPHFLGGSLGWHDFLASTARLFRHDPNYRIPVKADPNIVINHIRESHRILVKALEPMGAIRIGGMYGVLFEDGNAQSYQVSMIGYIRDVVTQLKRGLNGFWVAHPAFVRIGLALVESWRRGPKAVAELVQALVTDEAELTALLEFISADDVEGLEQDDPRYCRSVLAATLETSDVIANDHPDEIRYNIFQALQYICDWLCGNGCVALPATMKTIAGETVFVRVMDDLATTERSRWELWAEVFHGRVSLALFEALLVEELTFLQTGENSDFKRIQVEWRGEAARWYPIAAQILHQLVTSKNPVEFATELMMPFTLETVGTSESPLSAVSNLGFD